MRIFKSTAVAIAIASMTVVVAAQGRQGQRTRPGQPTPAPAATTYSRADAEMTVKRLYRAIFGREADTSALSVATADIQRGGIKSTIDSLFASDEFRNGSARKAPAVLLEQFYKGMLDRTPDTDGVQAYLPEVERRQYANVINDLVNSSEFRNKLSAPPASTPAPAPERVPAVNRMDAALACQGKVIEAVRREANGHIFVTFDRMPDVSADGKTVSGDAKDRTFDRQDRDMTYRCSGNNATFNYGDRRAPAAADARLRYPSGAVVNCEAAVGRGTSFDAAALSASDSNTEYVLGLVGNSVRQCTMDRQRVVSVK